MAFSGGGPSSPQMNVTPLIDVLLVLIIVFMVVVIEQRPTGLKAEIPQPAAQVPNNIPPPQRTIVIQVRHPKPNGEHSEKNIEIKVNDEVVAWDHLRQRLADIFAIRVERIAFIEADDDIDFQDVADVIAIARVAGSGSRGTADGGWEAWSGDGVRALRNGPPKDRCITSSNNALRQISLKIGTMNSQSVQRWYSRWGTAALITIIGTVSSWVLYETAVRLFLDYIYYPRVKAQDGYIYPQWRYGLFDIVLVSWCLDGLVASVLLLRSIALRESIKGWARRTTVCFFVGFGILVLGVAIGTWLRSHGI